MKDACPSILYTTISLVLQDGIFSGFDQVNKTLF